jgi:TetR/AcrR family transcriptional regulator, acrAB operon repressor
VTTVASESAQRERRPNQRHVQKAETRRRLLESATKTFIEQGPMTASLDEIAARAGVSRPTVIFHFGNRAALMDAVYIYHLENIREWGDHFHPGEFRPFVETFLRSQKDPVVRLLWNLGSLVHPDGVPHDHPEGPNRSYWHRFAQLEERIAASAGVSREEAHRRTVIVAPALLMTAQRISQDLMSEQEVEEFLDTMCGFALAPESS